LLPLIENYKGIAKKEECLVEGEEKKRIRE